MKKLTLILVSALISIACFSQKSKKPNTQYPYMYIEKDKFHNHIIYILDSNSHDVKYELEKSSNGIEYIKVWTLSSLKNSRPNSKYVGVTLDLDSTVYVYRAKYISKDTTFYFYQK